MPSLFASRAFRRPCKKKHKATSSFVSSFHVVGRSCWAPPASETRRVVAQNIQRLRKFLQGLLFCRCDASIVGMKPCGNQTAEAGCKIQLVFHLKIYQARDRAGPQTERKGSTADSHVSHLTQFVHQAAANRFIILQPGCLPVILSLHSRCDLSRRVSFHLGLSRHLVVQFGRRWMEGDPPESHPPTQQMRITFSRVEPICFVFCPPPSQV